MLINYMSFYKKYLKYKNKYLNLVSVINGGDKKICDKNPLIDSKKIKMVLNKKVILDKSVITKNDYSFTDIEQIIITDKVVKIEKEAFSNCINLRYVDMLNANNLKEMGEKAFYNCINLTNILIPKQTSIKNDIFKFCSNLKIVFLESKDLFNSISGNFLKDNENVKTISNDNLYFSCCDKNLRIYNGDYYLEKNKELKNDKIINITNEKTFNNLDLCKQDAYMHLLTRDGIANNHLGGFKYFDNETLFIIFSSYGKKNIWYNARRYTSYNSNILYFFDIQNKWFFNIKEEILKIINSILTIKSNLKKIIFHGTSMGGYMALYLSSLMNTKKFKDKQIICIAISPQTFDIYKNKNLLFHKDIKKQNVLKDKDILDIKKVISKNENNVKRYLIIGNGECLEKIFYNDSIMATNLLGIKNTKIIITPYSEHNIWKIINNESFKKLVINNFTTLFTDIEKGSNILNNDLEYLSQTT